MGLLPLFLAYLTFDLLCRLVQRLLAHLLKDPVTKPAEQAGHSRQAQSILFLFTNDHRVGAHWEQRLWCIGPHVWLESFKRSKETAGTGLQY